MLTEKNVQRSIPILDIMKSLVSGIVCLFLLNVGFPTEAEGML